MGKSKTRIFRKGKNDLIAKISRQDALMDAASMLNSRRNIEAYNLITMFGLSAEELLEAGAGYEAVTSIKNLFGAEL